MKNNEIAKNCHDNFIEIIGRTLIAREQEIKGELIDPSKWIDLYNQTNDTQAVFLNIFRCHVQETVATLINSLIKELEGSNENSD